MTLLASTSAAIGRITGSPWFKVVRDTATARLQVPPLVVPPYDFHIDIYAQKGNGDGGNRVWVNTVAPPLATAQILLAALQGWTAANGLQMSVDTPPKKTRKPRSDRGSKRPRETAESKRNPRIASELPTKPKAKRSPPAPWTYFVAEDYESYPSEEAATAALAVAREAWEERPEGQEGDPPALIAGRVLKTEYEPARTIPATVKVMR